MKTRTFLALALVLSFVLGGVAMAWTSVEEGVEWKSGDAGYECVATLGYDFGLKVDNPAVNGTYSGACDGQGSCTLADEFNNTITISNSDGQIFDWAASPFALSAVVVKSSTLANIFYYDPAAFSDEGLYSVIKDPAVYDEFGNLVTPAKYRDISHVSFCWNLQEQDLCYQEETAWAAGERYVKRGNWATYFGYPNGPVDILAGQYMDAGYLTFGTPVDGYVDITITLENGFIFYYDMSDEVADDNLKVQDYDKAPNKNPAPGLFDWKDSILVGSTTATINVPVNDFYGVHLDVAYPVPCE